MSAGSEFDKSRLSYGFGLALSEDYALGTPDYVFELLEEKGRAGVTSLYTSGLLAIDELPKTISIARMGRAAPSEDALDLLQLSDQAIMLDPHYDPVVYSKTKDGLHYRDKNYSPQRLLNDRTNASNFPEKGLAALYTAVNAGYSAVKPHDKKWRSQIPSNLTQLMTLNGTIDQTVMVALQSARAEGDYSIRDYTLSLLELARELTRHNFDQKQPEQQPVPVADNHPVRKFAGELAVVGGVTTVSTVIGEDLLNVFGRPSLVFVGATALSASIITRKISKRHK